MTRVFQLPTAREVVEGATKGKQQSSGELRSQTGVPRSRPDPFDRGSRESGNTKLPRRGGPGCWGVGALPLCIDGGVVTSILHGVYTGSLHFQICAPS